MHPPALRSSALRGAFFAVLTWASASVLAFGGHPGRGWTVTWGTAPQGATAADAQWKAGMADTTLRQMVRLSRGGKSVRLRLTNSFGEAPLKIQGASLALSAGGGAIVPGSSRTVKFQGQDSVQIPAGALIVSDPLEFDAAPLALVAISLHIGSAPQTVTAHPGSRTTSYLVSGAHLTDERLEGATTVDRWFLINGIDVPETENAGAVAILGDSITDGRGSTTNGNNRWPDILAERLQRERLTTGVLNQGIGGNCLLFGGLGPNAVSRLDRDVLAQPGVRWLIVFEGINDLGSRIAARKEGREFASRAQILHAYEQIIQRARDKGLVVYGATITPCGKSQYDVPDLEEDRQAINRWIRESGKFDAVLDFDAAVRDPANPSLLAAPYDSGDHLHLSPEGYARLAETVPLSLFRK